MTHERYTRLDSPVWWALSSTHQPFAMEAAHVKRYRHGILPFAAYEPNNPTGINALNTLLKAGDVFYLLGELPPLPAGWVLLKELPCLQMIIESPVHVAGSTAPISLLTAADSDEMFQLVNTVQPGYYERGTATLGDYYGIRQEGRLVAIAGERMRMDGLTEVSAVCTHPDYTGRQYAQHLTAQVCNAILDRGDIPFLHVLQTNERAIRLYEYLGFTKRRAITCWQIKTNHV